MRFSRSSTSTEGPGGPPPPSRSSSFFRSLRIRPATPPPPYSETVARCTSQGPTEVGHLKSQDTWVTVASTSPIDAALSNEEEAILEGKLIDRATAFAKPPPYDAAGHPPTFPRLAKPIVIPRVNPGLQLPYTRAYAPALAAHAIDQATFLTFIDHLNLVCTPHPAVKLIELAGFGLQFAPLPYADGLAGALQLVAAFTTVAVTLTRGRRYLARLNEGFFAPRGLHACTLGTAKMKAALGIPAAEGLVAPLTEETLGRSAQERCLGELRLWAAELRTEDLPGPEAGAGAGPAAGVVQRMCAWRVRMDVRAADRWAVRGRRRAWKRHAQGKKMKDGRGERRRVRALHWIVVRNLEDVEREREEAERAKAAKKLGKKGRKGKKGAREEQGSHLATSSKGDVDAQMLAEKVLDQKSGLRKDDLDEKDEKASPDPEKTAAGASSPGRRGSDL